MEALDANISTAANLSTLLSTLLGKKTITNGGTTTKQTMVDPNAIMTQLLEASGRLGFGTPGLAGTITQGKRAGLYGGSSTALNINDLLARVGTEAAIASAPTVTQNPTTTVKQKGAVSGVGLGMSVLALMAGTEAGRKKLSETWDDFFKESGTDMGDIPAELQGISPKDFDFTSPSRSMADVFGESQDAIFGDSFSDSSGNDIINGSSGADILSGFGAAAGTLDYANMIGSQGGDALGALIESNAANWGLDLGTTAAEFGADFADVGMELAGSSLDFGFPGMGTAINAFGKLLSGDSPLDAVDETANTVFDVLDSIFSIF